MTRYHDFHLELTESDARAIRIPDMLGAGTDGSTPSLRKSVHSSSGSISISVHPGVLSNPAMASAAIKLSDIQLEVCVDVRPHVCVVVEVGVFVLPSCCPALSCLPSSRGHQQC